MEKNRTIPDYDFKGLYPFKKVLSSSQFLCYEKSPEDFYVKYVLGAKKQGSLAMTKGRIFSAAYADRTLDYAYFLREAGCKQKFIDLFGKALAKFPVLKGGQPELAMIAKISGWGFRATLDDYLKTSQTVIENKTGEVEWSQERADLSDQITFQAWVHWIKLGVVPKEIILNWWNTKQKNYADVRTFKTKRTVKQVKEFEGRIGWVVQGINKKHFKN